MEDFTLNQLNEILGTIIHYMWPLVVFMILLKIVFTIIGKLYEKLETFLEDVKPKEKGKHSSTYYPNLSPSTEEKYGTGKSNSVSLNKSKTHSSRPSRSCDSTSIITSSTSASMYSSYGNSCSSSHYNTGSSDSGSSGFCD
ncbi:hypothetical protein [Priestia endophytica]|uniref:Uncharacterized protein n=1 Tax=Priestia endophytica DSM 13796 TaxID=1121089 RepID=A0A1I6C0H3_9BACI|nr:hypothetical protein [Priestia endophytica]KYG33436.1 hypothetical protein AZF06_21565 [Priestia endophytica]SFQ86647.1 hypothetical protein SAMN02745910_04689 [Priestia endophytica DSM 13796]